MSDQPAHPLYPGIQIVPREALGRMVREWNTTQAETIEVALNPPEVPRMNPMNGLELSLKP